MRSAAKSALDAAQPNLPQARSSRARPVRTRSARSKPDTTELPVIRRSFSEALDLATLLPRAPGAIRKAASAVRKTLLVGPPDWLKAVGLFPDLAEMDISQVDRTLLMRIRGALNRALPQPAEMDLRENLQIFFGVALAQGWVANDPMRKQPSVVGRNSKLYLARLHRERRHEMPDEDQIKLLLSDFDDWVARADWLTIEASTRPQEVRAVIWTDIKLHPRKKGNETGGSLTILRQMRSGKNGVVPGPTKTDQSQRTVEFGPELAGHLRRAMPPPAQRHQYVVSPNGQPVSAMQLLAARKRRQLRLGIAEVVGRAYTKPVLGSFFDGIKLRHAFAARRIAHGTPHTTLARQMGHKNYRITLNIYGYLFSKIVAVRTAKKGTDHGQQPKRQRRPAPSP